MRIDSMVVAGTLAVVLACAPSDPSSGRAVEGEGEPVGAAAASVGAGGGAGTGAAPGPGDLPRVRMVPAFPRLRFERPLCLAAPPDGSGRLVVVEQRGVARIFAARPETDRAEVFLDIADRVRTVHNEEGLLALAFHPRWSDNGHFFVYYSASGPRRNVLARFRAAGPERGRADPSAPEVLLEIPKPYGNHNGATLLFGRDGFLYVSIGDGGHAGDPHGNGQDLGTLLGKILRIDVDRRDAGRAYAVPADNPFIGRAGARPEIWAYGLRNVWRMSFDRETGELWAGDVGQDRWEEIDLIVKGGNYGWNLREGRHPFRAGRSGGPLIDPVVEYGRDAGASVTGGYVYRGSRLPRLRGAYVYADFVTGTLWAFRHEGGRVTAHREILRQPENIASFGEGPDGEMYLLAFDGRVHRFEEGE